MLRAIVTLACALCAAAIMFADTASKTWASSEWNSVWTGTSCTCDTSCTMEYQATGGNPGDRRRHRCNGKNDSPTGRHVWTGTWEDLGVTAGNTVSTVEMTALDYQPTTFTTCNSVTIGAFELRNSSDQLVATLWPAAGLGSAGGWSTVPAQGAKSVGALSASNSSIRLWMNMGSSTGNSSSAVCEASIDNLSIQIVHSARIINRSLLAGDISRRVFATDVALLNGRHKTRRIR